MSSTEDTLEVKEVWKNYARYRGVTINYYYANIFIFKDKKWVEA